MLGFFELPEAQRMALATRRYLSDASHCYRGFFPLPRERGWGCNKISDYGPSVPEGHSVKVFLEETNQWPDPAPKTGWADEALALLADLRHVSIAVTASLARAMGLVEGDFISTPARFRCFGRIPWVVFSMKDAMDTGARCRRIPARFPCMRAAPWRE